MDARRSLMCAAMLGFLAVALGAFAAHFLKDSGYLTKKYGTLEDKTIAGLSVPAPYKYLRDFETAVEYQMAHALALAITGLLLHHKPCRPLSVAAWCFPIGTALFSGSLYVLVLAGPRWLGVPWGLITPFGGTLYLAGWIALAVGSCRALRK
jgi:uncharacterized membrane protein YgdD (TMEM256/DUF423 family)